MSPNRSKNSDSEGLTSKLCFYLHWYRFAVCGLVFFPTSSYPALATFQQKQEKQEDVCKQALFVTANIPTCQSSRNTGGTNHINDGFVPLKCPSKLLAASQRAQYQCPGTGTPEWLLMLLVTPVLPLLWHVRILAYRTLLTVGSLKCHTQPPLLTLMTAACHLGVPGLCSCACCLCRGLLVCLNRTEILIMLLLLPVLHLSGSANIFRYPHAVM